MGMCGGGVMIHWGLVSREKGLSTLSQGKSNTPLRMLYSAKVILSTICDFKGKNLKVQLSGVVSSRLPHWSGLKRSQVNLNLKGHDRSPGNGKSYLSISGSYS